MSKVSTLHNLHRLHYLHYLHYLHHLLPEHHPYDVPEVITTSIEGGSRPYLDWLAKNVPEVSTEI